MPSLVRRRLLALSVPLLGATAGCLGSIQPGLPDLRVSNASEERVEVAVRLTNQRTGTTIIEETVALDPYEHSNGHSTMWTDPIRNRDPYEVDLDVTDGPSASKTFDGEYDNGLLDTGAYMIRAVIDGEGIELLRAVQ